MGMVQHDAYLLLLQGSECLVFLDGLSTNAVNGSCTTVFTERTAKIIDVCDIIELPNGVVVAGYGPTRERMVEHLQSRLLGRNISMTDISHLNNVYVGTGEDSPPPNATVHSSFFGTMLIVPVATPYESTWTKGEWDEHRIQHRLPFYGHEISDRVHPLACGLDELVHPNKGCYVGQEVLTRMRSRGKQGHRLTVLENPVDDPTTLGQTHSMCIVRVQ